MDDVKALFSRVSALERDVDGLKKADAKILSDISKIRSDLSYTATKKDIMRASNDLSSKIDRAVSTILGAVMTVVRAKR